MSVAAETREALRSYPYLIDALRAGIVNYAAAARKLGVSEDTEAVAAALRRFSERLATRDFPDRSVRLTMQSGVSMGTPSSDSIIAGTRSGIQGPDGPFTAIQVEGDVDCFALEHGLGCLRVNEIPVVASGCLPDELTIVVDRQDGPAALQILEAVFDSPSRGAL